VVLVVTLAWAAPARADDATDAAAMMSAAPSCDATRAHCFGIRLHVARTADGAMVATPEWFAAQLAMANKQFLPIDTSFQLTEVEFLDPSAARIEDRDARTALAKYKRGTVIDVFLTGYLGDIDKPGSFIRGVTWHTDDGGRLIILSTVGVERTLAHELGHFFGLPHSHVVNDLMSYDRTGEPFVSEAQGVTVRDRARRFLRSRELRAAATRDP